MIHKQIYQEINAIFLLVMISQDDKVFPDKNSMIVLFCKKWYYFSVKRKFA